MFDVIAQKLLPPSTAGTLIARTEIMCRLDAAKPHRILLLRAPAGYGKTSMLRLLYDGFAAQGKQVAWLTLDNADRDPECLLISLRTALQRFTVPPAATLNTLNLTGVTHLFLDDVEHLDEHAIRLLLSIIVEVLPPALHVYLAGRNLHQVSVANLKAKQALLELNLEQLRFIPAETEIYLRQSNLFLSENEILWLQKVTEGWPAAIELLVLAWKRVQGRHANRLPDLHGMNDLSDYLAEEVFCSQTEEVQAFLVATAPLQSFCGALADAIRESDDSGQIIARMRLCGLPIQPLGENWYRYHPLFAEHIVRNHLTLRNAPQSVYARAAIWLARHDYGLESFDCHINAGDYIGAADILETLVDTLRQRSQFPKLLHCCDKLPESLLRQRPRLICGLLVGLTYSLRLAEARQWLDYLRQQVSEPHNIPVYGESLRAFEPVVAFLTGDVAHCICLAERYWPEQQAAPPYERGVLALVMAFSYLVRGSLPQAVQMMIEARRICGESGSVTHLALLIYLQAYLDAIEGRLEAALQQMASIEHLLLQHNHTIPPVFLYSYSAGLLLMVLYERNQMDEVAERMKLARGLANIALPWDTFSAVQLIQARLMALQVNPASAVRWLENEVMRASKRSPPQVRDALEKELSRMAVTRGDHASIAGYAALLKRSTTEPQAWIFSSQEIDGAGIAQARLAIACGDIGSALSNLREMLQQAETMGRQWRIAKLRVLLALALEAAGYTGDALAQLALALEQAAQSGLVRTFLDEGNAVLGLLHLLQAQMPRRFSAAADAHLSKLLYSFEFASADKRSAVELTPSELGLLNLVALGQSNRDVAANLGISVNTVKWHMAQIFDKFGVSNRVQAVNHARTAGLLNDSAQITKKHEPS